MDNYIYPISISFFIKERVKFKITVSYNEDKSIEKIISYIDRIVIEPDFIPKNASSYLKISIEKIDKQKDAVMIAKVIGNYFAPIYFQKNILNIGFIPSGIPKQYYYMEVFKGEEGKIILNNKKYYGTLKCKLIQKGGNNDNIIYNISEYSDDEAHSLSEDHLEYNQYSQKLELDSKKIGKLCEDGCYLLITYIPNNFYNGKIIGTDFTLLSIISEELEDRAQLINIPLNEYIFGTFNDSLSINIHYFTVYFPDNSTDILFELNSNKISVYAEKGIKRFNIYNNKDYFNRYNYTKKYTYKNFELDYFGGQYITFALSNNYITENKYYYFRILQRNSSNDYLIYPLDTNKVNLCKTTKNNGIFSCFFLIDNIYKDLSNDIIISALENENLNYTAYILESNENIYSIDIYNLSNKIEQIENNVAFFKIDKNKYVDSKYILINIQSNKNGNLQIIANFYNSYTFYPTFNLYSYQLIYLNSHEKCSFTSSSIDDNKYRMVINNIYGIGDICAGNCSINSFNLKIRGKRILSFPITVKEEMKNIKFFNKLDGNQLLFLVQINSEIVNSLIEELTFSSNYPETTNKKFPFAYILKEIEYKGSDINIYFNFTNKNKKIEEKNIIIKGYALDYEFIKMLNNKRFLRQNFSDLIKGKFDERSNFGLIVFDKENIEKYKNLEDTYYLIVIDSENINSNISLNIQAISKNDSQFSLSINKYIGGSFNLKNNNIQSQQYYIKGLEKAQLNIFTFEFSSNYENIGLDFGNNIKNISEEKFGGIKKYNVCINYSIESENYFFVSLKGNNTNNGENNNYLENVNYILRYYPTEKGNEFNYKFDFEGIKELKNNYCELTIKNKNFNTNFSGKYKFTYIFSIFKEKKMKKK